jgi:hypothetical protein
MRGCTRQGIRVVMQKNVLHPRRRKSISVRGNFTSGGVEVFDKELTLIFHEFNLLEAKGAGYFAVYLYEK